MRRLYCLSSLCLIFFMGCGGGDSGSSLSALRLPTQADEFSSSNLKETGQSVSVRNYDDAYYKAGKKASYLRNNDIVEDKVTGLMWQDDSAVVSVVKSWVTQESYNAVLYEDTSGDTASSYCENLSLGAYADWRLPSKRELESIVDYGSSSPAINKAFSNVDANNYWTSSSSAASSLGVVVDFNSGKTSNVDKLALQSIRCVRGNTLARPTFVGLRTTVMDSANGRQWQDDYSDNTYLIKNTTWNEALNYCKNLSLTGKSDWRLPNINELKSLVDLRQGYPYIDNTVFSKIEGTNYASSTSYSGSLDTIAWVVSFTSDGRTYLWDGNKNSNLNVRCVRSIDRNEVITASELTQAAVLFEKCAACHGSFGDISALEISEIIAGKSVEYLISKLRGYRDGDQTGFGSLMKGQVADLSDANIELLAKYISNL